MSELDTRIALLLGWAEIKCPAIHSGMPGWGHHPAFDNRCAGLRCWSDGSASHLKPAYSASLDAQQEILAGLIARGWRVSLSNTLDPEKWCAHMGRTAEFMAGMEQGEAEACLASTPAEAMAEAICAALESEAKRD